MKKLNNQVKIEIFNAQGEVINTQVVNGVSTGFNEKIVEWVTKMLPNISDSLISTLDGGLLNQLLLKIKGVNVLEFDANLAGITILSSPLSLESNKFTYTQNPLGGVNSKTPPNDDPYFGRKNTIESCDIVDDNNSVIGYRLVCEFGEKACNGTIGSICLSPINFGANISDARFADFSLQQTPGLVSARVNHALHTDLPLLIKPNNDKTAMSYYASSTVKVDSTSVIVGGRYENFLEDRYIYDITKTPFKLILDEENNKIITINIVGDKNFELLTLDYKTKTIIDKIDIEVPLNYMNDVVDFGLLGEKYIILVKKGKCVAYDYTLSTPPQIEIPLINYAGSSGYVHAVPTYGSSDKTYACSVIYNSDNYSPFYYRTLELFLDDNDNIIPRFHRKLDGLEYYSVIYPYKTYPFGVQEATGYTTSDNSIKRSQFCIGYSPRAIYAINNLETPIEKTTDNTMKVTYDITWA